MTVWPPAATAAPWWNAPAKLEKLTLRTEVFACVLIQIRTAFVKSQLRKSGEFELRRFEIHVHYRTRSSYLDGEP